MANLHHKKLKNANISKYLNANIREIFHPWDIQAMSQRLNNVGFCLKYKVVSNISVLGKTASRLVWIALN